jgi:hypothetical protein
VAKESFYRLRRGRESFYRLGGEKRAGAWQKSLFIDSGRAESLFIDSG